MCSGEQIEGQLFNLRLVAGGGPWHAVLEVIRDERSQTLDHRVYWLAGSALAFVGVQESER